MQMELIAERFPMTLRFDQSSAISAICRYQSIDPQREIDFKHLEDQLR